jgi:hypothetical protein
MSYPENPNTIVLKNKYYPKGLREIDVWNHYQKYKRDILKETFNRDVSLVIFTDLNKPIIRRKGAGGATIRLSPKNYDTVITGRSVTLYAEMKNIEEVGIIDIDIDPRDGMRWAKKVTADVYDFVMDKVPIVRTARIRFTGKTSFHVVCELGRKAKIDSIRFLLQKFLRESDLARVYTVSGKRTPGVPNLDLAPNKIRGNYIIPNALSIIGLRCIDLPYSKLMSFDPLQARIV